MVRGKGQVYYPLWKASLEEEGDCSDEVKDMMERKERYFKIHSVKKKKKPSVGGGLGNLTTNVFTYDCQKCGANGRLTQTGRDCFFETTQINHDCTVETDSDDEGEIIPSRGCTVRQIDWVKELYQQNFKTVQQILQRMTVLKFSDDNLPELPSWKKMRSLLPRIARESIPQVDVSLAAFKAFSDANSNPQDDDTMYVPGYQEDTEGTKPKFRLCMSTRRLLCNFIPTTALVMYADDTADVIWCGFTTVILGFTDANRVFHIVIIALCSQKTTADYEFVYHTYKRHNPQHHIRYSLSDGAQAIFNGFKKVYAEQNPAGTRLMCWMHAYVKNFLYIKKSIGISDVKDDAVACDRRKHIRYFLDQETKCLHQAGSVEMFNAVVLLWHAKYVTAMEVEGQTKIAQVILYIIPLICTLYR
jgi:hypothetical protein